MNSFQKFFFAFMPASWRASAEQESKQWTLKCPNCQFERSYWAAGGIRWKASGNPTVYGKCPACGQNVGFYVYKKDSPT